MIKIAHEAPVAFMNSMKRLTDYDYALACLFGKIPGYYEYFEAALKEGRHVLLDNGLFEDGVPMNADQYANWIDKLRPTEYIIPDEFDKKEVTIGHFNDWNAKYKGLPGGKIAVCQGVNFVELDECYLHFSNNGADKIAINFASVAYQNYNGGPDAKVPDSSGGYMTWESKAVYGRIAYLIRLLETNVFDPSKQHHILGCVLPLEFRWLKEIKVKDKAVLSYFDTMDTSAPVVWGILTGMYPDDLTTINKKNKTKLKDLIETDLTPQQSSNIVYNVAKFRHYLSV